MPDAARALGDKVSKADLLEAAYHLAMVCSDTGDEDGALARLVEELDILRENQGRRAVPKEKRPAVLANFGNKM